MRLTISLEFIVDSLIVVGASNHRIIILLLPVINN